MTFFWYKKSTYSFSVHFSGDIRSSELVDGDHGFHVHENNDVTTCSTTGSHFKSTEGEIHGFPYQPLPER